KLATLYDKYTEYADILAGHGQLEVAQKYLDLLPTKYAAAEIARSRVQMATKKPAAQAAVGRQSATPNVAASRVQSTYGYQPPQASPGPGIPQPSPFVSLSQTHSPVPP